MHELHLCRALVRRLETLAREQGATAITELTLSAPASHRLDEVAMQQLFSMAAEGTVAEGATLHWRPRAIEWHCPAGHGHWMSETLSKPCPVCGEWLERGDADDGGLQIIDMVVLLPQSNQGAGDAIES